MSTVEKIKDKLVIEEVISRYLKLERTGQSLKAKCPFHNEKTPSFFVSPDRGTYYCFGCGAKGDIFTFVEEFERVDFRGALKILAEVAGVPIETERPQDREIKNEKERLFSVMEKAANFYQGKLAAGGEGNESRAATDYLLGRGLKEKTIQDWRLGFAPSSWTDLLDHLKKNGFLEKEIEKAGLIKRGEKSFYDRFRGRIMFPIFDPSGRVIAFSGRLLKEEAEVAKYINSPETPLFNKSETLYGYDRAKNAIRELNYAVLVEGQMDLLAMHQAGLRNTIASSGTALTDRHLKLLKRSSENLLLCYDGDGAGMQAALRAWLVGLNLGMEIKVAHLPAGEDPASLIQKDSELMKECLKNSKHIINFYLDAILSQPKITEPENRRKLIKQVEKELLPFVRSLTSNIDQRHFLTQISEKTSIPELALVDELNKISVEEVEELATAKESAGTLDFREKRLWGMIFWQESLKEKKLKTEEIQAKIKELWSIAEIERWQKLSDDQKSDLIFEAEIYYTNHTSLKDEALELLNYLYEDYLKNQFAKAMLDLRRAENDKKGEEVERLLNECQNLTLKLAELKKDPIQIK